MADPVQFEMIKQKFPELAKALQKNDTGKCDHLDLSFILKVFHIHLF